MSEARPPFERPPGWRTPEEKLKLVLGSYQTDNVMEYCSQAGIDRSYLYALRREMETSALSTWGERRPGRPAKETAPDPQLREELERTRQELEQAREEAVKWEIRAELQGLYRVAAEETLGKKKPGRRPDST